MERVRPVRCASVIEAGIENVFAMCSSRATIVNNERNDDRARSLSTVGNVFAPKPGPDSVAPETIAGAALISAAVSRTAGNLIRAVIGRRTTHPRRQRERSFRANRAEEAHGLFNPRHSFFHPQFRLPWKNDKNAIETRTQRFKIRRVKSGILPGKVHLAKDGAGRNTFPVWHSRILAGQKTRTPDHAKQSGKSEPDLERVFDTPWHVP